MPQPTDAQVYEQHCKNHFQAAHQACAKKEFQALLSWACFWVCRKQKRALRRVVAGTLAGNGLNLSLHRVYPIFGAILAAGSRFVGIFVGTNRFEIPIFLMNQ